MLEAGILVIGVVYLRGNCHRGRPLHLLNPRVRLQRAPSDAETASLATA